LFHASDPAALEHELARIAPDVEGFDSPARILIEILSLA
jgi:hypothetical protein